MGGGTAAAGRDGGASASPEAGASDARLGGDGGGTGSGGTGGGGGGTGGGGGGGGGTGTGGGAAWPQPPAAGVLADRIDWPGFLARHDLVWSALPTGWSSGAFVGNGLVGATISRDGITSTVRWRLGRTDVYDHRPAPDDLALNDPAYLHARLPIGDLRLTTRGQITGASMRLDLWNAEARATITTDKGTLAIRSFAHATRPLLIVELSATGEEDGAVWSFEGAESVSSRVSEGGGPGPAGYGPNPPGRASMSGEVAVWEQPLTAGGGYATARQERRGPGGKRELYLSIAFDGEGGAPARAAAQVAGALAEPLASLGASHTRFWHDLYRSHFLSVPDAKLESFYWIQIYKLASAGRPGGPVIDLMGPWFEPTKWPAIWWNLNVQLTYYPVYAANLLPIGQSLLDTLEAGAATMKKNVPAACGDCIGLGRTSGLLLRADTDGKEVGHLPWALHSAYLLYRHSMDERLLRERLFPLLRRSANYYLYLLTREADGKLHLPATNSPEYADTRDANYDLALLRWELETLVASAERLAIADPLLDRWKQTLRDLTPPPTDDTGLRIGRDKALESGHRHYSHLLSIFPLYQLRFDDPASRPLVERSYDHWRTLGTWRGYSWTGAASMAASFGRGDEALGYVQKFVDSSLTPNTMYDEGSPVIESPLSGARSLQDLLLQSWGGVLRVFPAVPAAWPDVTIHDMRAEGAFLVSAVRQGGATAFVRVRSLAGEPCRLRVDLARPLAASAGGRAVTVTERPDGTVELDVGKGEEAVITTRGKTPDLAITAVAPLGPACANFFGGRRCSPSP
jgi:hypothetical protein